MGGCRLSVRAVSRQLSAISRQLLPLRASRRRSHPIAERRQLPTSFLPSGSGAAVVACGSDPQQAVVTYDCHPERRRAAFARRSRRTSITAIYAAFVMPCSDVAEPRRSAAAVAQVARSETEELSPDLSRLGKRSNGSSPVGTAASRCQATADSFDRTRLRLASLKMTMKEFRRDRGPLDSRRAKARASAPDDREKELLVVGCQSSKRESSTALACGSLLSR